MGSNLRSAFSENLSVKVNYKLANDKGRRIRQRKNRLVKIKPIQKICNKNNEKT